jgi:formate dehydrogenase subunit gamma
MQQLAGPINYQDWNLDQACEAIQAFKGRTGGVMLALHKIQEIFGYVDDSAMAMLGKEFNLSRAEIHGVTSFYHDFKREKPGKYTIKVCQAEACQAMGSVKLTEEIKAYLNVDFHETTNNGTFTLEPVYCLGNCACSPNIMVDNQTYGRVSMDGFKALTESLAREAV